jgi:hypothetical protein
MIRYWVLAAAVSVVWGVVRVSAAGPSPEAELFEAKVRPVLAEHCWSCHGPKKKMAGLRLDSRKALLEGGDNGAVVKPGDPDNSPLIRAVRRTDRVKMPPQTKLPPDAVDALAAWVKAGVPWPETKTTTADPEAWKKHWAFQPVRRPSPPDVKDRSWCRTSIDPFVLAKLEEKGLSPSPEADARTLIRRLSFDLIGLPPTPEEVDDFVRESVARPQAAFEELVERLLASPHYGERWARHWLDVARFADTKGYVFFEEANYPWAWTYRDYVIRAFNDDLPFDRFILEQLAADRLDLGTDKRPLTALGFVTLGGRFMNNPHDILDDRIDVVCRGLLGLTVTCARCHDHKFDPIPSKDYYSLYGVFASCIEPSVPPPFAEPAQTEEYQKFTKELELREQKLAEFLRTKHAELIASAKSRAAEYLLAAHALHDKPSTEEFMLIADGNDLNPTMVIRWQAYLARTRKTPHPVWGLWHALAALPEKDFASKAPAACAELIAKDDVNLLVAGAFLAQPPKTLADAAKTYGDLLNGVERLPVAKPQAAREELRQVFHGPNVPANPAPGEINELSLLPDRPSQGKLQEFRKAVEQWRATGPGAPPRANVLLDLPKPVQPRVFLRGNPNNLGDATPRQFLGVLSGPDRKPFTDGSGRLELARAIADHNNPLTARVFVNRVWMHHFGTGLVRTPGDFGLRSDPPSHPELLDHLAKEFMESGWSVKKLHRLILLSAAYRQSSSHGGEAAKIDPENVLLWRMNRRRLDYESLRDSLLTTSGRLSRNVGGPSVADMLGGGANRRTLYGFLDRLNVPGLMRTFDFPSPDATSPQRSETTVPPQALFLMNHPFVLDCARRLIQRPEVAAETDPEKRMTLLYRHIYGRSPTADELALGRQFIAEAGNAAWDRYAHALLLANEAAFVD